MASYDMMVKETVKIPAMTEFSFYFGKNTVPPLPIYIQRHGAGRLGMIYLSTLCAGRANDFLFLICPTG